MNTLEFLRSFLAKELRVANAETLDPSAPLLQKGILDSIELMQLISHLESSFGISVDETEILPTNFRSLATIAGFIERKLTVGPSRDAHEGQSA